MAEGSTMHKVTFAGLVFVTMLGCSGAAPSPLFDDGTGSASYGSTADCEAIEQEIIANGGGRGTCTANGPERFKKACAALADCNAATGRTALTPGDGVNAATDQKLGDACDPKAHVNTVCNGHEVGVPAYCWHDPAVPTLVGKCVALCLDTNGKPSMTDPVCTRIGGRCTQPVQGKDEPTCVK